MTHHPDRPALDPHHDLRRRLGLGSAVAIVVGEVIGIGIFLTPAGMARSLGSPAWLLGVWLAMGLITIAGALCFGWLATRYPEAGGSYVYLREAFGPRIAFLYGWMSLLVTDPGLTALFASGLASAMGDAAGLSAAGVQCVAVGSVLLVAAINMAGVTIGAGLLRGLSGLKIVLLALIVAIGFGLGRGNWSNLIPFVAQRPGSEPLAAAIPGALIAAFFSFGGWWDVNKLAGEIRDVGRVLPRALILGVSLVTAVYALVSLAFLYLVPASRIDSNRAFAALAGEALFGPSGGAVFASVVALAVFGSLIALAMAAPRTYFALARDGLFPAALATVHPRTGALVRATAIQASLAVVLVLTGAFEQILAYFFFVTVAFLALTVAGVYVLQRRERAALESTPLVGYPLTPVLFLVPIAAILVLLAVGDPVHALLGVGAVLLGLPFSHRLTARNTPAAEVVR